MVSRRVREHAPRALLGRETGERVVGAAELEGARPLEVLAFEEDVRTRALVDRGGGVDGRSMRDPAEALRRRGDVLMGDGRRVR